MNRNTRWTRGGAILIAAICCLLIVATADAQSKKSAKQAENLEKAGDNAKAAVQDVLLHLDKLLVGYNSIIDGEAEETQAAYKKLVGDLNATKKKIEVARKQLATMNDQAQKFFAAWEQDLSSISSDSLREKSASRLESARERYATSGETLAKARDEFAPVVRDLNDQILFLGRDLSPEAVEDLQDEAAALNRQAEEVIEKVKAMLQAAGKEQDEAEAVVDEEEAE
jgi:hypothetical protein